MRGFAVSAACASVALMLSSCGPRERGASAGEPASAQAAANQPSGPSLFRLGMSEDEKAIRAGIKDDQGLLPVEILADRGLSDRVQATAQTEPEAVFKVYKAFKKDGLCDQPRRSLGEVVNLDGGGRMPVLRDPGRVCDFLLSEAAKSGYPDANFERGLQDVVNSEELYQKNARYFEPEIERLLQRAQQHFTVAQQSKTPGIPDAARQALAAFQGQQYARGYGGEAADRMRAVFLGLMAITYISEASKFAAAAQEHCRAVQAGAMAALTKAPNC